MKFGKRLQIQIDETLPEWRDKFLSYKPLKKRLKQVAGPEWFTAVRFCAASPQHDGSSSSVVDKFIQELRKGSAALGEIVDKPANESAAEAASSKPASEIGAGINDEVSSESSTHAPAERNSERKTGNFDEEDFINLINEELEKFNNFFLEKEEEYVILLQVTPPARATPATSRGRGLPPIASTSSSSASRAHQTPLPSPPAQAPASTSRGKGKPVAFSRKRGRGNQ